MKFITQRPKMRLKMAFKLIYIRIDLAALFLKIGLKFGAYFASF